MNILDEEDKGIMISPNFYKRDWENLDLNSNNLVNWKKAIDIFKDRIEGRYFRQIEVLDNNLDRKIGVFSGFAIMSLACLLIESLEQFCSGNKQTIRGRGNDDINNDAIAFFDFFKRSDEFETFFDTEEKANVFYTDFRCGLLHQGHTKNKSLIHIRCEPMLQWIDNENPKEGISIQRRKFLLETKKVYDGFVSKLENNDLNYRKKHLLKKMQYIVDQK